MVNYSLLFVFYRRSENIIKKAIDFILAEVDVPALNHRRISRDIKYKAINTKVRINSFAKSHLILVQFLLK